MKSINVLDLFCGCGGFSEGFKSEPFSIVCANDIWKDALLTYQQNKPNVKTILGDISKEDIKDEIINEFKNKSCDIMIGGPPCQSFSMAGKRERNDPRGKLFEDYLLLVEKLKPKVCLIENVKGILSMKHYKDNLSDSQKEMIENYEKTKDKQIELSIQPLYEKVVTKICNRFKTLGYNIEYKVLDCSCYNIAQKRERVIFIASCIESVITFPIPNNTKISVKDAIDDLKERKEDKSLSHLFSKHSDEMIEKIKKTKIGECLNKKYNDAFFKCDPTKPSRTVKENHGGVFLHYEKNRVMTPRELARLQSFQDDFLFCGTKSSILKQIGNAVPPQLSKSLAETVLRFFV